MSVIEVRPLASVPPEPWRNGGGITRTLATSGSQWRVSLAEIERDGPYSRFEGISRTSLILRGAGVILRDDRAVVHLKPFEAVEYAGDVAWNASLVDGPVSALNVMSAQGRYRVRVRALADSIEVGVNCAAIVVALDGGCAFEELGTSTSGSIAAGQMLAIDDVTRPLRLTPTRSLHAKPVRPALAVVVTIEPSGIRIND